ncbi:hypothetical protein Bca52824_051013 [Brassica carinata]|uniref:Homeobox domain-containing protein n=1 Tax=Brassica carinata TaxID=52824 RepID=A0A8X7R245_BRACI|nr:hypothetical protein Bca52824_051013 [Brassica carinata]
MNQEGSSQSPTGQCRSPSAPSNSTAPVRSRWSPKPEQILILESIFNSGIVNPPKDETVRIRKMLEQFGAVGDTNVFYWFQNRRSRSRRRQRQLQAATAAAVTSRGAEDQQHMTPMSMHHPYSNNEINLGFGSCSNSSANYFFNDPSSQVSSFLLGHSSSSSNGGCESNNGMENLFAMYGHESDHPHLHQHSSNDATISNPSDQNSSFHYQQVGDTNVFYWFQNRRSRSRRRQRQLQAATAAAVTSRGAEDQQHMTPMSMHHPYSNNEINLGFGSCSNSSANYFFNDPSSQVSSFLLGHSSSSSNGGCESNNGMENLFAMYGHESDHPHLHQHSSNDATISNPSDQNSSFHYQQGESFICMPHIFLLYHKL